MNTLESGAIVELLVNANAIPSGRYRYLGCEEGFLIFAIGRKILFGLSERHWRRHIAPLYSSSQEPTTRMEFLDRYYALLSSGAEDPPDSQRLTFCALDPSALLEAA